ncbi:MAG: hypothetical protein KC503_20675 [Myxococcales bacterium]|nr:hypothetical protein [Myxococcales bacterium]
MAVTKKTSIGVLSAVLAALVVALLLLLAQTGCGEEECLVAGENCASSYKQANYGTTDIYCCSGLTCTTNHLNDRVCR